MILYHKYYQKCLEYFKDEFNDFLFMYYWPLLVLENKRET